jgi:hypothetical protein
VCNSRLKKKPITTNNLHRRAKRRMWKTMQEDPYHFSTKKKKVPLKTNRYYQIQQLNLGGLKMILIFFYFG